MISYEKAAEADVYKKESTKKVYHEEKDTIASEKP